jgi:hypothetical protein
MRWGRPDRRGQLSTLAPESGKRDRRKGDQRLETKGQGSRGHWWWDTVGGSAMIQFWLMPHNTNHRWLPVILGMSAKAMLAVD